MIDPLIRKFAQAAGHNAARVLIPAIAKEDSGHLRMIDVSADDIAKRDRLAFRLAVAIAAACMAEYDKLHERKAAA